MDKGELSSTPNASPTGSKRHQKGEKRTSKDIGPPRTLSAEATILSATASVISAASQAYAIKKSMPTESELDAVRGAMRAANLR